MIESLKSLFIRDLEKLKSEISAYKKEENLWKVAGDINNSAGNLCLHIVGNLSHFIGAVLLDSGYIRHRESEFNDKSIPRTELIERVENTIHLFEKDFSSLKSDILQGLYPIEVFNYPMTTEYFLIHLQGHLNYHLGQVNYHRRILDI